jgi:hypothetical protein
MSGDAANQAAAAQGASTDASNKLQWQMMQQQRADNAMGRSAGDNALARMMEELGFGVSMMPQPAAGAGGGVGGSMVTVPGASGGMSGVGSLLGGKNFNMKQNLLSSGIIPPGNSKMLDPMGLFKKAPDTKYWQPGAIEQTQQYAFSPTGNGKKLFSGFQADPGYQFRLQQGNEALNNSMAARGGLLSGNALKAAMDYNSGQASQEYGNYWNRLSQTAGFGPGAINNQGQATQNAANNIGNGMMAGGNARASGYAARGQANSGMVNSLANTLGGMDWSRFGGGGSSGMGGGARAWGGINDYNASEIW